MVETDSSHSLDHLAQSALFGALSKPDRLEILALMRPVDFAAGQLIFSRGDAGTGLYLVLAGRVRLSILTADGRELSLAHASTGAIFGEIATLDGGERTADATTITATRTLMLPKSALQKAIGANLRIAEAAVHFLCTRLRETDQKLEAVALHPIEVRLARLLMSTAELQAPELGKKGKVTLELGISQSEIGLLIGASRPKVNAALFLLEAEGAIARDGGAPDLQPVDTRSMRREG